MYTLIPCFMSHQIEWWRVVIGMSNGQQSTNQCGIVLSIPFVWCVRRLIISEQAQPTPFGRCDRQLDSLFVHAFNTLERARGTEHCIGSQCLALIFSGLCLTYLTYIKACFFQSLRSVVSVFKCLLCGTNLKVVDLVVPGISKVWET